MAKTKKKKLNTDLDDVAPIIYTEETIPPEEGVSEGDDMSYTMGQIEVEKSDEEEDKEEFEKAAKTVANAENDDDDAEWVENEEYSEKDEDPYLDAEDYDPDDLENDQY